MFFKAGRPQAVNRRRGGMFEGMNEDERQELVRTAGEAHDGLVEIAFKLRRRLTPKCPALERLGIRLVRPAIPLRTFYPVKEK